MAELVVFQSFLDVRITLILILTVIGDAVGIPLS